MRVHAAVLGVIAITLAGCGRGEVEDTGTPGPPVPLKQIVLHDIQGMHGGDALWVAEDGTTVVQVVTPAPPGKIGLWENRYQAKVTNEQRAEIERLVGAHDFLRLTIKELKGVPDESHPNIMVVTKDGQ